VSGISTDYDLIVLGGGPGEHCAGALADGGPHVAVIERELVDGECTYWACIPSKTLSERRGPPRGCPPRHLQGPAGRPRRHGSGAVHRNRRRAVDGACALGPEAGEWPQQATLTIRASLRLEVVRDTSQPFPSSPETCDDTLKALRLEVAGVREPVEEGLR
jgi:pyruvate/2-oxoglutarate dehydrogenase complex dihydrolipoamide dehydrogenase (E3) component